MEKLSLARKIRYKFMKPHYPQVGIEFNSDSIRLAVIGSENKRLQLQHMDWIDLPPGTMDINPFKPNILGLEIVAEALRTLWLRNRFKSSKTSLLLQDRVALSFQVTLEHAPAN